MRKGLYFIHTFILVLFLAACNSDSSTGKAKDQPSSPNNDETIITGVGKPFESISDITLNLVEGKGRLEVKVKESEKDIKFIASLLPSLEGSGSSTTIANVYGEGNYNKGEDFNVTEPGKYQVSISGNYPDDFKGEWEIIVKQKPAKNSGDKQQLRLSKVQEIVGGRQDSLVTGDAGYGDLVEDIKINDADSLDLLIRYEDDYYLSKLESGKWTTVEESAENAQAKINELNETYSDFDTTSFDFKTSKGSARLISYEGKHYVFYEDLNVPQKEANFSEEFFSMEEVLNSDSIYWDEDKDMIYIVVSSSPREIIRYDSKANKFLTDNDGELQSTSIPFNEEIEDPVRLSVDKNGTVYAGAISKENYQLFLTAYDDKMNLIAEPISISNIFGTYGEGTFTIKATDHGVDIWNVFDQRLLNGQDYNQPTVIGINKFSVSLQ